MLPIHHEQKTLFSCINLKCHFYTKDECYKSQCENICEKIRELNTTVIILTCSYSTNGDVGMALRTDALLSHLVLEADMRNILLDLKHCKLSEQQHKVLLKAHKQKDLILAGHTGTGKTMLAAEAVKIKIAQYLQENKGNSENLSVYISSMDITLKKWLDNDSTIKSLDGLLNDIKSKWLNNVDLKNIYYKGFGKLLESDEITEQIEQNIKLGKKVEVSSDLEVNEKISNVRPKKSSR